MKIDLSSFLSSFKEVPKEVSKTLEYVGHGDQPGFNSWLKGLSAEGKVANGDYNFYNKNGHGHDYDFNLAYALGLSPSKDKKDGSWHWPDTAKKPNHPTFSNESLYSGIPGARPGRWNKETGEFIPPVGDKDLGKSIPPYTPQLGWHPAQPSTSVEESMTGARDQSESLLFKMLKGVGNSQVDLARKHLNTFQVPPTKVPGGYINWTPNDEGLESTFTPDQYQPPGPWIPDGKGPTPL